MEKICSLIAKITAPDAETAERVAAFGEIASRFQDMAYGCAYAILGDFHLAEDAAQEAFIAAYRGLHNLRDPRAFPGWFRRIIVTQCSRLIRRRRVPTGLLESAATVASADPAPDEAAEKQEMRDKVLYAIRALPEHERMVTTLFYINGYSQKDIAEFLEVPVTTVNNRLHSSRNRMKERMMSMVEERLKKNAPDERFSSDVIEKLLARPRPLEIEEHPVRRVWDMIRTALPEYEVIRGDEIADKAAFDSILENMDRVYHLSKEKMLRTQITVTTFKAIRGRKPPVRLLAAGRVFRPGDVEGDPARANVFHQADGICIQPGADRNMLKATLERMLTAVFDSVELRWRDYDFGFVDQGLEVDVEWNGQWLEVSGSGMLRPESLRKSGYDPDTVGGFAFGCGLERLAMLKFGIDDIHELWQPPHVPAQTDQ